MCVLRTRIITARRMDLLLRRELAPHLAPRDRRRLDSRQADRLEPARPEAGLPARRLAQAGRLEDLQDQSERQDRDALRH